MPESPGGRPTGFDVTIGFEILIVRTRKRRRPQLDRLSILWDEVRKSPSKNTSDASGIIAGDVIDLHFGRMIDLTETRTMIQAALVERD